MWEEKNISSKESNANLLNGFALAVVVYDRSVKVLCLELFQAKYTNISLIYNGDDTSDSVNDLF